VDFYTSLYVKHDGIADYYIAKYVPDPFMSALVHDCVDRGKAIGDGGAIYDIVSGQTSALANISNSLAAIKKLVFEEKKITASGLMQALETNFETEEFLKLLMH
jgi:formate C-acetyltransferase